MTSTTRDLTQGKPLKIILLFSLPIMFGNIFQQCYALTDSIVLGRGVGADALAALGAADWINWLVLWAVTGLAQGFSVLAAEHFGAKDYAGLKNCTAMIICLYAACSLFLTAVSQLAAYPLLLLLRTDPQILADSLLYLRIQFGGIPIILAYNIAAALLRCAGNSRAPFVAILIASVLNIGLDIVFVMDFGWGIAGAAAATVIAQAFSFLYCLLVIARIPVFHIGRLDWKLNFPVLRRLCYLGLPAAAQGSIIALGGMVFQSVVNSFGLSFVAGCTAANKVNGILESTATSLDHAMTAYMGQNHGACQAKRIDQGIRAGVLLATGLALFLSGCMLIFGEHILSLFISAQEVNRTNVLRVALQYLQVMSCSLIALFLLHIYRAALTGLGRVVPSTVSGGIELVMRVGVSLTLPHLIGVYGVFFAEVSAWIAAAVQIILSYYFCVPRIKRRMLQPLHVSY